MKDLREMDSCRSANPVAMPDELRVIDTPLRLLNWKAELRRHPRPAVRSYSCARSGTGFLDRVLGWPMSLRELEAQHAVGGATARANRGLPVQGSLFGQNH